MQSRVAILKTDSGRILDDYRKLLELIDYKSILDFNRAPYFSPFLIISNARQS